MQDKKLSMHILITGGQGQLGCSLKRESVSFQGHDFQFIDIETLDLTDKEAVANFLYGTKFDLIINCAAYTAVDLAEREKEKADSINRIAVANIAEIAAECRIKVIHISTDYVFNGESEVPYIESMNPDPATVYGETKLEGEKALLSILPNAIVVRTAWLYSQYGHNFFLTMRKLALQNQKVNVVMDQIGSPTFAGDLAKAILKISLGEKWEPGIYHFTNKGEVSWFEFAREIYRLHGADENLVTPVTSAEYNSLAPRPKFSVLDTYKIRKTYNIDIPEWKASLNNAKQLTDNL